ncbi:DUF4845 domain-containing protein [Aquabacterium soli]|uniref:DUF4845 domain-containing protein n=2 Tax=Aquabacterium soli TaxID=2493092 RepID=A0A426VBH5_9BURK|nr:DUF4845 domain-containing protein [Aquabacterium soli]
MARRQRGITLFGLLFWAVIVGAVAVVLMKLFPAINEYRTIQSVVNAVAKSGASSVPEVRTAFDQRSSVEYGIESITSRDLEITKDNDQIVIRFAYDKEIELIDPVFLVIKFKGHSR